ncbi:MAG: nucleotidyltransferase domain-containing protein [Terriglobales bacterium]
MPAPETREFDLLLACAGSSATIPRGDFDWVNFLRMTEHHRVIPQVYSRLCDAAPDEIMRQLRRRYEANVRQTLRLTRDLVRVVKDFEGRGIRVLAYKGPALAAILDGDLASRQYSDIDLLVHPSDVRRSRAALVALGYIPHDSFSGRQEKSYVRSGYEYAFDLADGKNALELKWRVVPHFYGIDFDIDGFFKRAATVKVSEHQVRSLCPEDLLLVLCVHAAKHTWAELSLLSDIARLIGSQPMDWDAVLRDAKRLGVRRILLVNLALVHDLLGGEIPISVLTEVRRKHPARVSQRILPMLTGARQMDTESIGYFRLMLALRERWQDRARFLCRLIFTPGAGEWEAVRLPPWLFPLYRGVRIYRLAGRLTAHFRRNRGIAVKAKGLWPAGRPRAAILDARTAFREKDISVQ